MNKTNIIPFNSPCILGTEISFLEKAISNNHLSGDGRFSHRCQQWFNQQLQPSSTLLTTSCSSALDMCAILANIKNGDEVIMPSYTFVSTANSFITQGAKVKFIDIRPDTMNMNETLIESAITNKTRAIVPVHYAGVPCEMSYINRIAAPRDILIIEDAAQGMLSTYNNYQLGTLGTLGAYSFHETKNYTSGGEGGLLIINDPNLTQRAEIIREKGTNRSNFLRGQVDKYTWIDRGSSFLPSELNAAYLLPQLEASRQILKKRLHIWNSYYQSFKTYCDRIELPQIPLNCEHNGHMFYLKMKDLEDRTNFIQFLKEKGVYANSHYIPLHSSPAGKKYGEFVGNDTFTTKESERLVRLPLFYNMTDNQLTKVIEITEKFLKR